MGTLTVNKVNKQGKMQAWAGARLGNATRAELSVFVFPEQSQGFPSSPPAPSGQCPVLCDGDCCPGFCRKKHRHLS